MESSTKKNPAFTVDAAFIIEAHSEACAKWQRKLEAKFPQLFIDCKIGTRIKVGGKIYLVAQITENMASLIDIESGVAFFSTAPINDNGLVTMSRFGIGEFKVLEKPVVNEVRDQFNDRYHGSANAVSPSRPDDWSP